MLARWLNKLFVHETDCIDILIEDRFDAATSFRHVSPKPTHEAEAADEPTLDHSRATPLPRTRGKQ